jgi:nucleoside-diphosphate-sugar epimerase
MPSGFQSAFVTGGSGFIGGRLVRRLAGEGVAVRALARSDPSAAKVTELGAEAVRGDLDDPAAMAVGAERCDVTFHLAAFVAEWGKPEEFERGNVDGTRNALEASRRAGAKRFVHCGTEAAILAGKPLHNADETVPLRPDSPALYAATKAQAEALVREANGDGIETVVVRPRFVWGAGDTTLLPEIAAAVEAGKFAWVGGGTHRTSATHVDNVVEGLIAGAEHGAGGEAYFVTDGEPVVFRDFISELLRTQGVDPPDRSVPTWVAGALARGGEAAWKLLPLGGSPPLTRFALWAASQECTLDDSKARAELGYAPVRSQAEGLAELAAAHGSA